MQFNPFGKDETKISRVGLGCWQLGSDWGDLDLADAKEILKTAADEGITFFDTADVYGGGRSEEIIGDFLKDNNLQDEIFVATKLGRFGDLYPDNYTESSMRGRIEESLKRLKTDSLDLVQLHCIPSEQMNRDEVWAALEKFTEEGKIKRYGASVESMEEALLCIEKAPSLSSLQIIFNIFRQKPIKKLFKAASEKKVGLIARVPLASGLLSGKFSADTTFADSDHRNYNKDGTAFNVGETFAGLPFEKGVTLADEMKPHIPEGMTFAQMALRWILDYEEISVVIPGATRAEQARSNAAISDLPPLDPALHQKFRAFYKESVKPHIRGPY